jgi:DNA replication protein DnaC
MPESKPIWVIPQGAARWWYSPDLVAWIKNAEIDRHQNREYLISELLRPEIMVLDDFGKERWTEWVSEIMNTVFERRMSAKKCLIVTSNMTIAQIDSDRDLAIGSRLSALVEVILPARDRRAG